MKKIGKCPICKKGEMLEGSNRWACNYFKSFDDKCTFSIYKEYFGKQITEEIAIQLIKKGKTNILRDLKNQEGNNFSASLVVENGFVKPFFKSEILKNKCPKCSEEIEVLKSGFGCKNFQQEENKCDFFIPNVICGKNISIKDAENLLRNRESQFFDDFEYEDKKFSAQLVLDENHTIRFNNKIGRCPKCKKGSVFINKKAFNCTNFNTEIKCDFTIWKNIAGRRMIISEIQDILEKGETKVLSGFKKISGENFKAKLTLNNDYKTKFI